MNNKGFTLVELLVSVALLAMISLIITPTIMGVIKDNKIESCKKLFSSAEQAAKVYVSDNRYGSIPGSITAAELKSKGYLTNSTINQLTKTDISSNITVTITFNTTTKKYKYETKYVSGATEKEPEEYCQ